MACPCPHRNAQLVSALQLGYSEAHRCATCIILLPTPTCCKDFLQEIRCILFVLLLFFMSMVVLFWCDFLFNIKVFMSTVMLFNMYSFMITAKIQFLESEKVGTCRAFCCWLSWVNQYTLVESETRYRRFPEVAEGNFPGHSKAQH